MNIEASVAVPSDVVALITGRGLKNTQIILNRLEDAKTLMPTKCLSTSSPTLQNNSPSCNGSQAGEGRVCLKVARLTGSFHPDSTSVYTKLAFQAANKCQK